MSQIKYGGRLVSELEAVLPTGMSLPPAIRSLYEWMEFRGQFVDTPRGRIGSLTPCGDHTAIIERRRRELIAGEFMEFAAQGSGNLKYWFGRDEIDQSISDRLCVFVQTGADGSMGAFWLGEDGEQKIVHLGSGSGSTLACILAESAVDFLRLIAVGYEEICWGGFSEPPDFSRRADGRRLNLNQEFRDWVCATFGTSIPSTGDAIVKFESDMFQKDPPDAFCRWVQSLLG